MPNACPRCLLPNTTLQWHETARGWVCLGCYYGRRQEQSRIEAGYPKIQPIKSLK